MSIRIPVCLLILLGLCITISSVSAALAPSEMPFQVQQTTETSNDDEAFMQLVDTILPTLTVKTLNETAILDLKSSYYEIAKFKVSPDLYPDATNITTFLFYTLSANELLNEYNADSGVTIFNNEVRETLRLQANADLKAAKDAWNTVKKLYPNSTPYTI